MKANLKVNVDSREEISRMVAMLPDDEIPVARRFIEYLRDLGSDPVLRALVNAPLDDEPETPEEAAAMKIARAELSRGEVVAWSDVKRKLTRSQR